jgi:sRNA-binding protein
MAKKMDPQAFEAMRSTMETLAQRYPKAFPRRSIDVKPLMVGISNAILADMPDIRPHLGRALQWWTSRPPYLDACTVGAARIDLTGATVGGVTESEAAFAAARLAKRLERRRREVRPPVPEAPPEPPPPSPVSAMLANYAAARRRLMGNKASIGRHAENRSPR